MFDYEKGRIYLSILVCIGLLTGCSEENIIENNSELETERPLEFTQNESYSDQELQNILLEEDSIFEWNETSRVVDISGMDVSKENPKKVYMHYMPWFQSKPYDGFWGQHWTMTNQNPDIIDENGHRQIASHFYPIIGPYSSSDPDLQEYHFLLMKLAGVDGVIFDWYGNLDMHDYQLVKNSTNTFIDLINDLDLEFSIMYEDRVAQNAVDEGLSESTVEAAQKDFQYIYENYFSNENYLKVNNTNTLFIFGPHYITEANEWGQIFEVFPEEEKPNSLTLWAAQNRVGESASGEFLWVDPSHLAAHQHYYEAYSESNSITIGGAYPGFNNFHTEGGWWTDNDWIIDHHNGQTFTETLNYTHHETADMIQVITWNDFGEGTMIEPTYEHGFLYIQLLQQYTGVEFEPEDFQTALDLYITRKQYKDNQKVQKYLDRVYIYFKQKRFDRVDLILNAIHRRFPI